LASQAACDVCGFAHEQAADKADVVLLNSYKGTGISMGMGAAWNVFW
jgi:hypothetical protein